MDAACTSPSSSSSLTAFFLGGNHQGRSKVQPSSLAKEGDEGMKANGPNVMNFILDEDQQQVYFR
jgi:hypothetical protein